MLISALDLSAWLSHREIYIRGCVVSVYEREREREMQYAPMDQSYNGADNITD